MATKVKLSYPIALLTNWIRLSKDVLVSTNINLNFEFQETTCEQQKKLYGFLDENRHDRCNSVQLLNKTNFFGNTITLNETKGVNRKKIRLLIDNHA